MVRLIPALILIALLAAPPAPVAAARLAAGGGNGPSPLSAATLALERGRLDEAARILEPLARDAASGAPARHLLAALRVKQGRVPEALRHLEAAVADPGYSDRGEALLTLGALRLRRLELVRARAALDEATRLLPEDPRPFKYLGILEESLSRFPEARAAFARAAPLAPGDAELAARAAGDAPPRFRAAHHAALAESLLAEGDLAEAARQAEMALALEPAHPRARCVKGIVLRRTGRPGEAAALFAELALASSGLYAECQAQLGIAFADLGRDAEAVEAMAKALDLRPDLAPLQEAYALALERLGRTAEALLAAEAALAEEYDRVDARALLARLRGDPDGTGDGLRLPRSLHYRGRGRLAAGDLDGALAAMEAAFALDSADVELLRDLVTLHRVLELPHLARRYLDLLERAAPADPAVPVARGYLHFAAGETDEAEIQFRLALARNPQETLAMTGLARLALARGDLADALARFERLIAFGERSPTALAGHCETLDRLGRLAEAEPALHALLREDPGNEQALRWLERLGRSPETKGTGQDDPTPSHE